MFKSLQVLRTTRTVKTVNGVELPSNTRLVVIKMEDDLILARVADTKFESLRGERVKIGQSRVKTTKRGYPAGRPRKPVTA